MPDNVSIHKPSRRYDRSTVTIRGLSFVAYGLIFGGYGGLVAVAGLFGCRGYPGRYLVAHDQARLGSEPSAPMRRLP